MIVVPDLTGSLFGMWMINPCDILNYTTTMLLCHD